MRVFILSTGRNGSTTFIKACNHIQNFTAKHESLSKVIGEGRFNYPDNHIESDNRLSWFLGQLDKKFGNDAFYVHMIRNKEETVDSYNKRWRYKPTIVKAFSQGILMTPVEKLNKDKKKEICSDYYDCVNANIELFLKDKDKKMIILLENIQDGFREFWHKIDASGNINEAIQEFDINYNKSKNIQRSSFRYRIKLFIYRVLNLFNRD